MKRLLQVCLISLLFLLYSNMSLAINATFQLKSNSLCFSCHNNKTYTFFNEVTGRKVTKRMNPYFIIDSALYSNQNHNQFECTDCHSYDYNTFPHDNSLQMEEMPACMDCHEGDEQTARFNFEQIQDEFTSSVHSSKHSETFSCWMCHSPHFYKFEERKPENILEIIQYDNNICLSCHSDVSKYNLISSHKNSNIIQKHDWLPNQAIHFEHVRCIECHTKTNENLIVAHNILPKEQAIKKCSECHSKNSKLIATLYKFERGEKRLKSGFINSEIIDSYTYVIGANKNAYLVYGSWIIAALILLTIFIHFLLRKLL